MDNLRSGTRFGCICSWFCTPPFQSFGVPWRHCYHLGHPTPQKHENDPSDHPNNEKQKNDEGSNVRDSTFLSRHEFKCEHRTTALHTTGRVLKCSFQTVTLHVCRASSVSLDWSGGMLEALRITPLSYRHQTSMRGWVILTLRGRGHGMRNK